MKKITILIADDEPPARQRLALLLASLGDQYQVVAEVENGLQALQQFAEQKPDLLLLDIRMPVMDGLEAARALVKLDQPPSVIFVTAFDTHAVEAFEANAIDYLLKPIRKERLQQALERAGQFNQARQQSVEQALPQRRGRSYFCMTQHGELLLVPVVDVRLLRAEQKYVTLYDGTREYLLDESLKALEQEFSQQFLRIHRNAMVAVNYVVALEKGERSGWRLRLDGITEPVEVSRRHLAALRSALRGR